MFTAEQRIKEIGIRKVSGASVTSLFALLSKEFILLILLALMIASPLAWFLMNQWLQGFACKIDIEWWMFALPAFMVIFIAVLMVGYQGIRAVSMNPVKSLRLE